MKKAEEITNKFKRLEGYLNERVKHLWCANEAISIGREGIELISKSTGKSRTTISNGIQKVQEN